MKTPSPLIPQGTFVENRNKSHVRIAVFTILAVHVVLLGALLLQGCKRTTDTADGRMPEPTNIVSLQPPPLPPPTFSDRTHLPEPPVTPPYPSGTEEIAGRIPPTPGQPITPVILAPEVEPEPPPPPPSAVGTEHVIIKGDTFSLLSRKYGVSLKDILEANPNIDPRTIQIGQAVYIPPPPPKSSVNGMASTNDGQIHVVKSGDTLIGIGNKYGVTARDIRRANNLRTDRIKVGQKLAIPAPAGAP